MKYTRLFKSKLVFKILSNCSKSNLKIDRILNLSKQTIHLQFIENFHSAYSLTRGIKSFKNVRTNVISGMIPEKCSSLDCKELTLKLHMFCMLFTHQYFSNIHKRFLELTCSL